MEEVESTFVRAERMTRVRVSLIFNKKFATEYIINIDNRIKDYFLIESTEKIRGKMEFSESTELNSLSTLAIDQNNAKITAMFTTGDFPTPQKTIDHRIGTPAAHI